MVEDGRHSPAHVPREAFAVLGVARRVQRFGRAAERAAPYGIDALPPWTTSRVAGTPDPPQDAQAPAPMLAATASTVTG